MWAFVVRIDRIDYALVEGGQRRALLSGLSQQFAPGRFACLTGPSGTGKTTILSLLAGVVRPDAGRVLDGETDIAALAPLQRAAWRRATVGLVFQTCRLIDVLSVAEHMALVARLRGRPDATAAGHRLLAQLGLAGKLGQRPGQLSGGEKQRVALAQALAARPRVVLADEPTAALDRDNAASVAAALRHYAETSGAVVVAVSHDQVMIDAAHDEVRLVK
jgi:putative ABC transport system ATP-binding protein